MNADRRGDWMMTYSGRAFWPLDPRPDEVDIVDIARALSHQCRYNGHCAVFYSVAEHSVKLADWFRDVQDDVGLARQALLHDAAEAYLGDMIRPLKRYVPDYLEAERAVEAVIFERFGLPAELDIRVRTADQVILTDERDQLFDARKAKALGWHTELLLGVQLELLTPPRAYGRFMATFGELFPEVSTVPA